MRAFNIFQLYLYLQVFDTFYRRYFYEYLIQHSLKSGGTKDHLKQVKVPGTAPYWKAWCITMIFPLFLVKGPMYTQGFPIISSKRPDVYLRFSRYF